MRLSLKTRGQAIAEAVVRIQAPGVLGPDGLSAVVALPEHRVRLRKPGVRCQVEVIAAGDHGFFEAPGLREIAAPNGVAAHRVELWF